MRTAAELQPQPAGPGSEPAYNASQTAAGLKYCAFWRLPYFNPMLMASYDGMHTIAGLMADLFGCMKDVDKANVLRYEAEVNK